MNKTRLIIAEGTKAIDYIWGAIEEIVIPDGVIRIGYDAFADCTSLTSITIPNSVTEIGGWAFYNCISLKSIYIDKEKDTLDLSKTCIPTTTKVYWKGEF